MDTPIHRMLADRRSARFSRIMTRMSVGMISLVCKANIRCMWWRCCKCRQEWAFTELPRHLRGTLITCEILRDNTTCDRCGVPCHTISSPLHRRDRR